jgi:hypothetical protein
MTHFLQDLTSFFPEGINRLKGLLGKLKERAGISSEDRNQDPSIQTSVTVPNGQCCVT